jgi:hypothetical protein
VGGAGPPIEPALLPPYHHQRLPGGYANEEEIAGHYERASAAAGPRGKGPAREPANTPAPFQSNERGRYSAARCQGTLAPGASRVMTLRPPPLPPT